MIKGEDVESSPFLFGVNVDLSGCYRLSKENELILNLKIQAQAKTPEFSGRHGDSIKLKIAAPPVDGKANEEVIRFLSRTLGLPQNCIEIIKGLKSSHKQVILRNIDPERVLELLQTATN